MAAVRSVSPRDTWGEYADAFLKFCTPRPDANPLSLVIVMDTYGKNRIKEMTQRRRGKPGKRIYITNAGQAMPKANDWEAFLSNSDNKTELIHFLVEHYKSSETRAKLEISLIITESENTWHLTADSVDNLGCCNHHKADTRAVLHASESDNPVVVVANDTDILVLLTYACNIVKPTEVWMMKIDSDRYISVTTMCNRLGDAVCNILPAYHSITGCDTTSFPFGVGKVKPFKKMIKTDKMDFLSALGETSSPVHDMSKAKTFFQTVMYSGKENEDIVHTRIRMYEKQRTKSSCSIIPDPNSTDEHLKRADYQTYIWRQCIKQNIDYPLAEGRGWIASDDGLIPLWFSCSQFPPSLSSVKSRMSKSKSTTGYQADNEESNVEPEDSDYGHCPPRKRSKKHVEMSQVDDYDAGDELHKDTSDSESDSNLDSEAKTSDDEGYLYSINSAGDTANELEL